ncbi:MAG: Fic family protein [Candidatus Woesearchaeota archaeon]
MAVHIEIRKIGKKIKYFLSYSYREGPKVHKFRKYLGQDLKPELLEERKKIAEKLVLEEIHRYNIIKDPLQIELSAEELEIIKQLERQIPLKIKHLSEKEWSTFSRIFAYNTNAIEGSKLSMHEVQDLLEQNKWPDRSKEDIAEAFGVNEAISYIRKTSEHVSLELIKSLHKIVFRNSKPFAGKFRKKGEEVVVMSDGHVIHEGAPQARVLHLLRALVSWYEQNKVRYPTLALAAVVHNQFENIHPFKDGNGRVGRVLLNNILIKHNLPPINIDFKNRAEYYDTLQAYEKLHDLKPTIEFFMKEYKALKPKLDRH